MKNKIIAGILILQTIFCIAAEVVPPALAAGNTVNISDAEDFAEFSEKCRLDSWSRGKTVILSCDIDFSGKDFSPIASFGGTFIANGHTLSGIDFEGKGSYQGVFRYTESTAKISGLNVKGKIIPGGSKGFVGGIVGENAGTLENCSFSGTVKGENVVGGIAANNTESGKIVSCAAKGSVIGENSTGGIAGKNSGFIYGCTNNAAVNTVYEEKETDISDIDTDTAAVIETIKNAEEENAEESIFGHTDTGGVAGYSSGIIQGCTNNADIGYNHVGYNVGGIVGRQSGYMLGCKNYGSVFGRKDVGGIVGQAEPYILLNASSANLRDLRSELNTLNKMVNKFITDTDNLGDDAEKYLTDISNYSKQAQECAEDLLAQGTDFADDNLSEINAQSAILSNTLDKLVPCFDSLESGGENLTEALDELADALENLKVYSPELSDDIDDLLSAISDILKSEKSIRKAIVRINNAKRDLEKAIKFDDEGTVKKAFSEISDAVKDIITAKQGVIGSLEKIEKIISSAQNDFGKIDIDTKAILENLKSIKDNSNTILTAMRTISQNLDTIILNTEIDFARFKSASQSLESAAEYLGDAMHQISKGFEKLSAAVKNLSDDAEDINKELTDFKERIADSITHLSYATDDITSALGDMHDIFEDLSNEKPLEFVKLGDDFKNASESLFDSLTGISSGADGLKNVISAERKSLSADLSSISNQFDLIMNLLIDEVEELSDSAKNLSDIFLDASDEDIEATRQGKVADCINYGVITADRNTGGIAGALAIEYTKDPEDDIEKPSTLNFTYRTKIVLQSCINEGDTVCKKDCAGGIAGVSEIGTIYKCENYANIESTSGNYVGGIVGKSDATVRKCYAKGKANGKRYVGGIVGKASTVAASYAIAVCDGDENIGAICGAVQDRNMIYGNFFVDNGIGAIDGISYASSAEPIDYNELKNKSGIPSRFVSFTVTFTADDEVVKTENIEYGESTDRIDYPEIPEKEGFFGNWQEPESETVTEDLTICCEYSPYITVLSSSEKDENGKLALALAEGNFTDKAELHITDSNKQAPKNTLADTKVYDISLKNTDIKKNDNVKIRILNPDKDKVSAQIYKNGNWEKIKTTAKGKYTILEMTGTENTVCLKYESGSVLGLLWIIPVLLVLAAAVFVVLKFKKNKK